MTLGWWILAALAAVAAAAGAEAWIKRGRRRPLAEMIERSRPAGSPSTNDAPRGPDGPAARMPWLMPMSGRTADSMIARPHASWTADEDQKTGPKAPTDEPNQTSEVER